MIWPPPSDDSSLIVLFETTAYSSEWNRKEKLCIALMDPCLLSDEDYARIGGYESAYITGCNQMVRDKTCQVALQSVEPAQD